VETLLIQSKCTNWEDMVENFRVNCSLGAGDNEIRAFIELNTERKNFTK